MRPILVNIVGVSAAIFSMASFLPQALKIWRAKDAANVSLRMYVVTAAGFALWTGYGALLGSWPLVGSNLICFSLAALILFMKLRFG